FRAAISPSWKASRQARQPSRSCVRSWQSAKRVYAELSLPRQRRRACPQAVPGPVEIGRDEDVAQKRTLAPTSTESDVAGPCGVGGRRRCSDCTRSSTWLPTCADKPTPYTLPPLVTSDKAGPPAVNDDGA